MKAGTYAANNLLPGDVLANQRVVKDCESTSFHMVLVKYRDGTADLMKPDRPVNVIRHQD